jgi:type II secretion system protein C
MQIINLNKTKESFQLFLSKVEPKYAQHARPISITLFVTFLLFIIMITIISNILTTYNNSLLAKLKISGFEFEKFSLPNSNNTSDKYIIGRNIFNLAGTIPFEDMDSESEEYLLSHFEKVPCSKTEKPPVELVGIIYTENSKTNLVTMKDSQATNADVYHEGDAIFDHDGYSVYKVTSPVSVQLRRKKIKICLSLPATSNIITTETQSPSENIESYDLKLDFVKSELGDGFSKILTAARLVPEVTNDKMQGFKIFSINSGTIFDSIKLENGDIIQNVNGVNLQDPEQGFKIYEAFQDENNITLNILRNGVVITKKVTIQ